VKFKIGIDVGGTFTDFLLADDEGNSWVYKVLSTPSDPSIATLQGLEQMAADNAFTLPDFLSKVKLIVHGTTITTNMVLTGRYVKTGFITCKGFRDYLNERRGMKRTLYSPKENPPTPIVPRYLIHGVEGRIDCEGNEFVRLNETDVYRAIEHYKRENVEAVAVNLFFSFLNPVHELKIKEIVEKEMPGIYVCLSHQVLPQVRIYERGSTTVFNACVAPGLRAYIISLTKKLENNDFKGILLLMQSNGGVMSPDVAMDFAVNTLLSGPAGGPGAGLYYANKHRIKNLITVDMGGTSFDSCLIRNGEPEITIENEVNEYRIAIPSLAIHTIGAGGGSIAWLDGGILKIGPQSAGADPGPVCYGLGGMEPTVTDANLVLGYLDPNYFLGGKMRVKRDQAVTAIREKIAEPLGLDVHKAAFGMYKIINTNMAQGVRSASVARGYDPRSCALIIAGGAGPVHACDIARELDMKFLLVPKASSVFCATGMLLSNLRHDYVRVFYSELGEDSLDVEAINTRLKEMKEEGYATLEREGIPPQKMHFTFSADLRYLAQFNEIEIPFPTLAGAFSVADIATLQKAFDEKHDTLYGYNLAGTSLEMICLRARAEGRTDKPKFKKLPFAGEDASAALKGRREIFYENEFITSSVYEGPNIRHGNRLIGPAIIEEPTTTIFVTPDFQLTCDEYGSYLLYPKETGLDEILEKIRKD